MAITPRTTAVFEVQGASLATNTNTGVTGDYVVLTVATDGTPINTPTGWTPLFTELDSVVNFEAFGRFLTGGADDDPTVTSTGATRLTAMMHPFGGVDTTTPMDATPVTTGGSSATSLSTPAITTVTAGAYALSGVAIDASAETYRFTVSGTGWSQAAQTNGTARRQATATKSMATAGSTGQATFTQSGGALQTVGFTIALRPSATSGGTGPVVLASSPPMVQNAAASTLTTQTFDAPAGSTLVAVSHSDGAFVHSFSNSGTALTWDTYNQRRATTGTGSAAYAVAKVPADRTGMTVTVTMTGTDDIGFKVYIITGADQTNPLGAKTQGASTSNTLTTTAITTTRANSLGFVVADDFSTNGTTTSSDLTATNFYDVSGRIAGGSGWKRLGAAGTSATFSMDAAGTAAADWNWLSFEIVAPSSGPAVTPLDITATHGATVSNSTTATQLVPTYPTVTVPASGRVAYYMFVHTKPSTVTVTTPANWTAVGSYTSTNATAQGVDVGPTKIWVFKRESATAITGSETLNITSLSSGHAVIHAMVVSGAGTLAFSEDWMGGYTLAGNTAANAAVGGSFSGVTAGDLAAKDELFFFVGHSGDNRGTHTFGSATCTGVTFGTAVGAANGTSAQIATSSGNDSGIGGWRIPVTAGSNTGTTLTLAATAATGSTSTGSSIGLAFRVRATSTTAGSPPVADAGVDASVLVNTAFNRTGSGTNSPTAYSWSIVSGPAGVTTGIIGSAAALSYTPTVAGTYNLRLTVTNASGSDIDDMVLTVNPPAPTVNVGVDTTRARNTTLDRSPTVTNSPTSFVWTITSGPVGAGTTIGTHKNVNWTPTVAGTYVLRCTASNVTGSAFDELQIVVSQSIDDPTAVPGLVYRMRPTNLNLDELDEVGSVALSTGGLTLTQGTTAKQPLAVLTTTHGEPGLRFDGVDDELRSTTNMIARAQPMTIIAVMRPDDHAQSNLLHLGGIEILNEANEAPLTYAGSSIVGPTGLSTTTESVVTHVINGASSQLYVNGSLVASGNPGTGGISAQPLVLANHLNVGLRYFDGDVFEVLVYDHALTTTEHRTILDYVNNVYDVAVLLPPVADAGVDASVVQNQAFTRTGTATNSPTSYAWTIVSGPAGVTAGTNIGNAAALSYTPTIVGTYVLRLTATNAVGSGTDDMTLTVTQAPPVANAGVDATAIAGVAFNRTGTATNSPTGYSWVIQSGPAGVGTTIGTAAALSWTPSTLGTYVLRFTASNSGGSGFDDVTVTVNPPAPVANAGVDATITVDTAFTRTGTATNSPTSYAWTIVSGPAGVTAGTNIGNAAALSYTPTIAGTYTLRLTATNVTGSGTDDLVLTVNPPIPAVDAGADATIVQNGTFNRTGTATNSPTSYSWTITSGPAGVTAGTQISTAAALSYVPTISGTYVLRLTATNATGSGFDELTLTVTQAPPVVDAGADATITLGQTFTRGGTGTNSPTSYNWTVTSGPAGVTAGSNIGTASTLSYTPTIVGTYVLRLTAANSGGSAFDELTLTVNYAAPTVDAGADAGINLGSAFTRTASEDLKTAPVTSRQWSIVSAPGGVTTGNISGQTTASLNYTPTVAGTYVLRYTLVTSGGTATDDLTLTVTLQPPTANAGVDASVLVNNAFSRTGTDTGVNITARQWTLVGPNTVLSSAAAVSYTPTQAGVYTLRYTVTNAAGSASDDLVLTVNGPPIVNAGADATVANRTQITRNATESGGGGVTAREWRITAGPSSNTVLSNTSSLDWTPTLPGTYTITYSATNPFGTGTDTLVVTVTAITIGLASSSASASSIVNPTLARRARITVSGTSLAVVSVPSPALLRVRKVAGTKSATATATGTKPRKVTQHARTISGNTPMIGTLATRRTFKETVVEQASGTITGTLRGVRKLASTSVETTPTVTSKLVTARKSTGNSTATSTLTPAGLLRARKLLSSSLEDTTATLRLSRRSAVSKTISAEAIVRTANLLQQRAGAARAAASSDAEGTLINARRIRSTSTEVTTSPSKLSRAVTEIKIATAKSSTSRKLNSTTREFEVTVQAGVDYTVQLAVVPTLLYDGMIAAGRIYIQDIGGALRQLSGTIRAITSNPTPRLQRATRASATLHAAPSTGETTRFYRIGKMAARSDAASTQPPANLIKLRTLSAPRLRVVSSLPSVRMRAVRQYFRRIEADTTVSRRLGLQTRFRLVTLTARSRIGERSGYAVLTTAKAVTTSPSHRARQIRILAGYVTAVADVIADLVVAPPREYTQAKASVVSPNLRRRGVVKANTTALSKMTIKSRKAGKLSTVIRIFEGAELDAYVTQENYTGDPQHVTAPAPPETPVYTRRFLRPR